MQGGGNGYTAVLGCTRCRYGKSVIRWSLGGAIGAAERRRDEDVEKQFQRYVGGALVLSNLNDVNRLSTDDEGFENNKWVLGAHKKKGAPRFDTVVDLIEYYKDLIGTGNFCKVFRGTYERDKNDVVPVAIKICHGASIQTVTEEAKQARESMIHEAQLMSYYVHKHVIQLYGVACDHYPVMIVMEYCPGGNLQEHMQKYKQKVSTNERILLIYEAAKGMRYLHSKGCVHRDLAARNCLISDGGIKISDFGLSKIAEELEVKKAGDDKADPPIEHIPLRSFLSSNLDMIVTSAIWMAPETLKRPQLWSTKSDVWSFGVLLYEVFNDGGKPWPNDEPKRIATHIRFIYCKGVEKCQIYLQRLPRALEAWLQRYGPSYKKKLLYGSIDLEFTSLFRNLDPEVFRNLNPEARPTMDDLTRHLRALHRGEFKVIDFSKLTIRRAEKSKTETFVNDESDSQRSLKSGYDEDVEPPSRGPPNSKKSKRERYKALKSK
ncbi:hypothetical protein ANCCAN_19302 [Ancylostoma caninum]|uniref:Protein kinase domain-containing protein n=1 Tax=Ancylostoma caninum TaxID=29170 RepID=A0A368FV43_ANCCA|nr:hypothetical protein ANCCAN_19302 [Ancylostoma caninum]